MLSRMDSAIVKLLHPQVQPVALRFTDSAPPNAFAIPEGKWGCVMWLLASAAKGRPAAATRGTSLCLGGGTGLGFGNQYLNWPGGIECFHYFLSTGNEQWEHGRAAEAEARAQFRVRAVEHFVHGERYLASPELVRKFVDKLPMTDVPTKYVVLEPLDQVAAGERPEVVVFLVDADRLAGLAILAGFGREDNSAVIMPQAAGCQSIGIFAYAENRAEHPRAVVGPTDISARLYLNRQLGRRDLMTFAVPFRLYQEMEANVGQSLMAGERWQELLASGK